MEIPTEKIIAGLENIIPKDIASGQVTEKTIRLKLDPTQRDRTDQQIAVLSHRQRRVCCAIWLLCIRSA